MLCLFKCSSVAFFLYTEMGKFCFRLVRWIGIKVKPQKFDRRETLRHAAGGDGSIIGNVFLFTSLQVPPLKKAKH